MSSSVDLNQRERRRLRKEFQSTQFDVRSIGGCAAIPGRIANLVHAVGHALNGICRGRPRPSPRQQLPIVLCFAAMNCFRGGLEGEIRVSGAPTHVFQASPGAKVVWVIGDRLAETFDAVGGWGADRENSGGCLPHPPVLRVDRFELRGLRCGA